MEIDHAANTSLPRYKYEILRETSEYLAVIGGYGSEWRLRLGCLNHTRLEPSVGRMQGDARLGREAQNGIVACAFCCPFAAVARFHKQKGCRRYSSLMGLAA